MAPPQTRRQPEEQPLQQQDLVDLVSQRRPDDPLRILFVHRSATGGHAAAAKAVTEELNKYPNVQAESLNLLSAAEAAPARKGEKSSPPSDFMVNASPRLRKLGFDLAFKGSLLYCGLVGLVLGHKASKAGSELQAIKDRKPDLVVVTHSPVGHMLGHWKNQGEFDTPIHSIPTDFRTHRLWKDRAIEHYYVAPGGSKEDLERFGVKPEQISETGIPIKPIADTGLTSTELKVKLGLDPNKPMVLVSGGSLGLQPYGKLVAELEKLPEDFQIVCITAKNAQAKEELEALPAGNHPLHVTGLVGNMNEYIGASDIVLTKPGGLTCSEILAQEKPMVFAELYKGLETPLIARMVEAGVAIAGQTAQETAEKIGRLLSNPEERDAMQARVTQLSRPDSARTIAQELLRAALTQQTQSPAS